MNKKEMSDVASLDEQDTQYVQNDSNFWSRILDRAKGALLINDPSNVDPKRAVQMSDERAAAISSRDYVAAVKRQGGKLTDQTHPEWTPFELEQVAGFVRTRRAFNVVGMPMARPEHMSEFISRTGLTRHEINTLTPGKIRARVQPARETFTVDDAIAAKLSGILGVGETAELFLNRTGLSLAWVRQSTREQIIEAVLNGLKHEVR